MNNAVADAANGESVSSKISSARHVKKVKSKKRKQGKQSPEDLYQIERTSRYNELRHVCSKSLRREAKIVKSFECQKIVRAMKTAKENVSAEALQKNLDDCEEKKAKNSSKTLNRLTRKLDRTKKMDLEMLVEVGLKRLGVLSFQPADEGSTPRKYKQSQTSDTQMSPDEEQFFQNLLESMFRHRRLSAALDQLGEKVTEYRQWIRYREAMLRGAEEGKNKKKKTQHHQAKRTAGNDTIVVADGFNKRKLGLDLGGHEGSSGLFIGSLSGITQDGEDETHTEEGYDEDHYEYKEEKKKNRPGQRARKAKALAIEMRNAGKTWNSSTNWREKKKNRNEIADEEEKKGTNGEKKDRYHLKGDRVRHKGSSDSFIQKEAQHTAIIAGTREEKGNANDKIHPSWAAAKKSKGITKFQGTKITFD